VYRQFKKDKSVLLIIELFVSTKESLFKLIMFLLKLDFDGFDDSGQFPTTPLSDEAMFGSSFVLFVCFVALEFVSSFAFRSSRICFCFTR